MFLQYQQGRACTGLRRWELEPTVGTSGERAAAIFSLPPNGSQHTEVVHSETKNTGWHISYIFMPEAEWTPKICAAS